MAGLLQQRCKHQLQNTLVYVIAIITVVALLLAAKEKRSAVGYENPTSKKQKEKKLQFFITLLLAQ